jgi:Protein of unknown function (DUF3489)
MSKPEKKRSAVKAAKSTRPVAAAPKTKKIMPNSKKSRIIAMLRSSSGATISAMMKATGWQKHSMRGFLAGVVRKRLNLKLESTKVGDDRIYRIAAKSDNELSAEDAKRQAA